MIHKSRRPVLRGLTSVALLRQHHRCTDPSLPSLRLTSLQPFIRRHAGSQPQGTAVARLIHSTRFRRSTASTFLLLSCSVIFSPSPLFCRFGCYTLEFPSVAPG